MSFHTHVRCERCEEILHVDNEEELLEQGWLVVSDGRVEENYDLCSVECLVRWAENYDRPEASEYAEMEADDDEA